MFVFACLAARPETIVPFSCSVLLFVFAISGRFLAPRRRTAQTQRLHKRQTHLRNCRGSGPVRSRSASGLKGTPCDFRTQPKVSYWQNPPLIRQPKESKLTQHWVGPIRNWSNPPNTRSMPTQSGPNPPKCR